MDSMTTNHTSPETTPRAVPPIQVFLNMAGSVCSTGYLLGGLMIVSGLALIVIGLVAGIRSGGF